MTGQAALTRASPAPAVSFFSLSDRVGRVRYFAYCLLGMVACCLLLVLIYLFALLLPAALGKLVLTVSFIIVKNVVVPMIVFVMSIRRLHDLDFNGWWSLCVLIPFVTLILLVWPGQATSNRFGPPPPPTPNFLKGLCVVLPVAIVSFYFYMVEINTGLVRPGAPTARSEGGAAATPPPVKLPAYR